MRKFLIFFLGLVTLAFLVQAAASLTWRIEHDSPLLLYMSFLTDRFGYIPYRDFFDMNMLGALWMNGLIGRLAGYQDWGYRIVDLAILAVMMLCTALWMRSFNRLAAWASAVLFGCLYLMAGSAMALQREYLLLLPISIGLALASLPAIKPWLRYLALGLAFGVAAAIKPQAAIGLLPFLVLSWGRPSKGGPPVSRARWLNSLAWALGFLLPLIAVLIYLWQAHALRSFLDIAWNYWPLYTQLNGGQVALSGGERLRYLLDRLLTLRDYPIWLAPALLGLFVSQYLAPLDETQRGKARLIFWLAVCFALYTLAGGTFWLYHWLPFGYFLLQLASLSLLEMPAWLPRMGRSFAALTLVFCALSAMSLPGFSKRLTPPPSTRLARVDFLANFLGQRLHPGERVQPLDWTGGGVVQAMLIAGAQPATPFFNDFHFYHHLSSPYIQGLRKEFIQALKASPPRFIISYAGGDKPWLSGEDTSREFGSLKNFLEKYYRLAEQYDGLTIYEVNRN